MGYALDGRRRVGCAARGLLNREFSALWNSTPVSVCTSCVASSGTIPATHRDHAKKRRLSSILKAYEGDVHLGRPAPGTSANQQQIEGASVGRA